MGKLQKLSKDDSQATVRVDGEGGSAKELVAHDATLRIPIGLPLAAVERSVIEATLGHFKGNKRRTAEVLGCSLKTLYNKLAAYGRADAPATV